MSSLVLFGSDATPADGRASTTPCDAFACGDAGKQLIRLEASPRLIQALSFRGAAKRRTRNPVIAVGGYWIPAPSLRTQVGFTRLGHRLPISGRPEIGGPGMTTERRVSRFRS